MARGYFLAVPFRSKGRKFYKTRVTARDGRSIVAGTGTDDWQTAKAIERFVRDIRRKRKYSKAVELIVDRRLKLPIAFDAFESGTLDDLIASYDAPDLAKLLDEWPGDAKYKIQVRRFLGSSFLAPRFTRKAISEFLAGLRMERTDRLVSGATRNRYRAALSVFGAWLVEREILPHNPVRDVRGSKPNPARMVWLDRHQAKALIAALNDPHRAIEALMCATGIEWQVVERLRRRDIDFDARSLHASGSKTIWRNRVVRATELWAWDIFASYARDFTDNALIFGGIDKYRALTLHKRASAILGLPVTTLHDWRHSYAVQALRDGISPAAIASNLGHRDTYLLLTRYGRFTTDERDFKPRHAAESPETAAQALGRDE